MSRDQQNQQEGPDQEAAQILALLQSHSLWITERLERLRVGEPSIADTEILRLLQQEMSLSASMSLRLLETYLFLRHLHFARRKKVKIESGLYLEMSGDWTPFDWAYNCFPLPASDMEVVTLDYIVDAMHEEADRYTEWDRTSLGRALHIAHLLVCNQGTDGLWASRINLRTGEDIGTERSDAPRNLMRRLNKILDATEFDMAISCAEAGIASRQKE